MGITLRQYGPADFKLVSDFLIANFQPGNQDGNWLQPAWEYMHSHPSLDESSLDRIGIWESAGDIVAIAHYESRLGEAFFQVHPGYTYLKPAMLEYAESHLCGQTESGERYVRAYVNDLTWSLKSWSGHGVMKSLSNTLVQFGSSQFRDHSPESTCLKGFASRAWLTTTT